MKQHSQEEPILLTEIVGDQMPNPPHQEGQDLCPPEVAQYLVTRSERLRSRG